jgi:hypothetical protein
MQRRSCPLHARHTTLTTVASATPRPIPQHVFFFLLMPPSSMLRTLQACACNCLMLRFLLSLWRFPIRRPWTDLDSWSCQVARSGLRRARGRPISGAEASVSLFFCPLSMACANHSRASSIQFEHTPSSRASEIRALGPYHRTPTHPIQASSQPASQTARQATVFQTVPAAIPHPPCQC